MMHLFVAGLLDGVYRPHGNILDVINDHGRWGPLPFKISPQNCPKKKTKKKGNKLHKRIPLSLSLSPSCLFDKEEEQVKGQCSRHLSCFNFHINFISLSEWVTLLCVPG